jgi:hypothetical protein
MYIQSKLVYPALDDPESCITQKFTEADCVSQFCLLAAPGTDFESSRAIVD